MIYLELFYEFFLIGLFTFGGGYAMIPLVRETVINNGWLTLEEFYSFIGVCESTPGPIAVNMATYVGSTQGGILGSFVATLGVVLPSFTIILLIAICLKKIVENKHFKNFIKGKTHDFAQFQQIAVAQHHIGDRMIVPFDRFEFSAAVKALVIADDAAESLSFVNGRREAGVFVPFVPFKGDDEVRIVGDRRFKHLAETFSSVFLRVDHTGKVVHITDKTARSEKFSPVLRFIEQGDDVRFDVVEKFFIEFGPVFSAFVVCTLAADEADVKTVGNIEVTLDLVEHGLKFCRVRRFAVGIIFIEIVALNDHLCVDDKQELVAQIFSCIGKIFFDIFGRDIRRGGLIGVHHDFAVDAERFG